MTGGDALIEIQANVGTNPKRFGLRVNGRPARQQLAVIDQSPGRLTGLLTGLGPGRSSLTANSPHAQRPATRVVFNSPRTGPVLSGPQQQPYFCRTEANGLGPPLDQDCSASTRVDWFYRNNSGEILPLAGPDFTPADMSATTLQDGRVVEYRIRMESGTINRAVYRWAMLDPDGDLESGWNQRFVYRHGGGCTAGYQQGMAGTNLVLDGDYLDRGFAVLTSSLNVMATACNDVLSAETASMVKEYVIEQLGRPPVWTIGAGGSGGSMQIQMNIQNYPGLFDGVLPTASFPDNSLVPQPDCRLLYDFFDSPAGSGFDSSERVSVTGIPVEQSCRALGSATGSVINASEGCANLIGTELRFHPLTNPGGIRCSIFDSQVNVWGRDPGTGFARRAVDNVGRQYGLRALQEGQIDLEQFIALNEGVGGFDNNGDIQQGRSTADPEALETAFGTGRVNRGLGGASGVPIIDARVYADGVTNVHISVPALEFRERLRRSTGTTVNHLILRARGQANTRPMNTAALDWMTEWLDRIHADDRQVSLAAKVADNRPAQAIDTCWVEGGVAHAEPATIDGTGICNENYPPFSTPMMRSGAPLGHTVLKCSLKPLDPSDYGAPLPAQVDRLRAIFPDGVCDFGRASVGEQVGLRGTWLNYGAPRATEPAAVRARLRLNRNRVNRSRRGGRVVARVDLSPCPAAIWQPVRFERLVKQGRRWHWRAIGTVKASGERCRAARRISGIRRHTRIRARVLATQSFRTARTPVRTVRVRGPGAAQGRR